MIEQAVSLRSLVEGGRVSVVSELRDASLLQHVVRGCLACGGPEDARNSFTTYFRNEGKLDGCWLCRLCTKLIFRAGADEILLNLSERDILVRNPEMRKAYLAGKVVRTEDVPAGFVLEAEEAVA